MFRLSWRWTKQRTPDEILIRQLAGALRSARVIVARQAHSEAFDGGDAGWLTLKQIDLVLEEVENRKRPLTPVHGNTTTAA